MTDHPFKFQPEHDGSLTVESAVYQALGAASMCWDRVGDEASVFDDTTARAIGEALLERITAAAQDVREATDTPPLAGSTPTRRSRGGDPR